MVMVRVMVMVGCG